MFDSFKLRSEKSTFRYYSFVSAKWPIVGQPGLVIPALLTIQAFSKRYWLFSTVSRWKEKRTSASRNAVFSWQKFNADFYLDSYTDLYLDSYQTRLSVHLFRHLTVCLSMCFLSVRREARLSFKSKRRHASSVKTPCFEEELRISIWVTDLKVLYRGNAFYPRLTRGRF